MPSLTRRDLIRWLGYAGISLRYASGCTNQRGDSIFSHDQLAMLNGLADVVLPEDDQPGGAKLGAVAYIEGLLRAFEAAVPAIYAGGPFSDRVPFADSTGQASTTFPDNDFATYVELDRVNEAAWRLFIYGSPGLAGGAPNEVLSGPVIALADQLKAGLEAALAMTRKSVSDLSADEFARLFDAQPDEFRALVIELVTEAAFAAPEYGGNPKLAGWNMIHFEGDSLPLGYSQWNGQQHVERAEAPLSTANPSDPEPLTDDVREILRLVIVFLDGRAT